MKRFLQLSLLLSLLSLIGCKGVEEEATSDLRFFQVKEQNFDTYINDKPMPDDVDLTRDKTLLNRDYPIEVSLYKDGKFYYDLPNLGSGRGTYEFVDGKIHLFAKERLFDMHIDVVSINQEGTELVLKFRDRFGPKILMTELKLN